MSATIADLQIREAQPEDDAAIATLWMDCGLSKPWNPAQADIDGLRTSGHGALLVGTDAEGTVIATVMVGHDGHRGWLYYVAVASDHRGQGIGRHMVQQAESWLADRNVPKAMLMVRPDNNSIEAFYRHLGYTLSPVNAFQRWLSPRVVNDQSGKREVTVTYLEMAERPSRTLATPPAVPHAIMRLYRPDTEFYRFMHDTIGRRWLWYERRLIDDDALRAIIHDYAVEIFILYIRGNPAGFLEIDRRRARTADIRFLGLMESQIGQGFGRYLLDWAIEQAWQGATDVVTVNTCTLDHPKALPLYQRSGFVPVRRETSLIDDPALIIKRLEQGEKAD